MFCKVVIMQLAMPGAVLGIICVDCNLSIRLYTVTVTPFTYGRYHCSKPTTTSPTTGFNKEVSNNKDIIMHMTLVNLNKYLWTFCEARTGRLSQEVL